LSSHPHFPRQKPTWPTILNLLLILFTISILVASYGLYLLVILLYHSVVTGSMGELRV